MIDYFEIEELVRGFAGLDDEADIDEYLAENFDVSFENFSTLIEILLPLIVVAESPLTGRTFKGFGENGLFYIKQEIAHG